MSTHVATLALVLWSLAGGTAWAQENDPSPEPIPAAFAAIKAAPADKRGLKEAAVVNNGKDEEEEGAEMPSSITYYQAGTKDYATTMTVTDLSLCKRPSEREICASFRAMISGPPPALGTDVTHSRIGGSGYHTMFLARVEGVKLDGVDAATTFLGGDTQDSPQCSLIVYVYARRGSNLVQLTAPVGRCNAPVRPKEGDVAYYRRACLSRKTLEQASAVGKQLVELFRLER
jgi:hypothetical protein